MRAQDCPTGEPGSVWRLSGWLFESFMHISANSWRLAQETNPPCMCEFCIVWNGTWIWLMRLATAAWRLVAFLWIIFQPYFFFTPSPVVPATATQTHCPYSNDREDWGFSPQHLIWWDSETGLFCSLMFTSLQTCLMSLEFCQSSLCHFS